VGRKADSSLRRRVRSGSSRNDKGFGSRSLRLRSERQTFWVAFAPASGRNDKDLGCVRSGSSRNDRDLSGVRSGSGRNDRVLGGLDDEVLGAVQDLQTAGRVGGVGVYG